MNNLTLAQTLSMFLNRRLENLHTALPAVVESYDPKTRLATVLPAITFMDQSGASVDIKPIQGVPCMFPSAKDWEIVAPISAGDTGLMICTEASLGNWINSDGKSKQVIPEDITRFSMQDAIFIVGIYPTKLVPAPHDGLWIRYKNTSMNLTDSEIRVKGNLIVEGKIEATEEVAAMTLTPATMVKLSTHLHGTGVGPTTLPQPGT